MFRGEAARLRSCYKYTVVDLLNLTQTMIFRQSSNEKLNQGGRSTHEVENVGFQRLLWFGIMMCMRSTHGYQCRMPLLKFGHDNEYRL